MALDVYKDTIAFLETDSGIVTAFGDRIQPLKIEDNATYPFAVFRS